jgi:hypothetical protein
MNIDEHLRNMTNAKLAQALDYIGSQMRGGISDAILKEAAKRLREEPEAHFVSPPPRNKPPLKAYAIAD